MFLGISLLFFCDVLVFCVLNLFCCDMNCFDFFLRVDIFGKGFVVVEVIVVVLFVVLVCLKMGGGIIEELSIEF